MKKITASIVIALVLAAISATSASAATFTLVIHEDIDMIPVGTIYTRTVDVPADVQGLACQIGTLNGRSVHTQTTATFESAGATMVLVGIEDTPFQTRTGTLTLGPTLTGTLSTGQDPNYPPGLGGYSAGAVVVTCPDAPPTTTTTPPPDEPPAPPVPVVTPPKVTG